MRKGMEQGIFLVIAAVVGLVVALIVITLVRSSATKTGESTISVIDTGKDTLKIEMCRQMCEACEGKTNCVKDPCKEVCSGS